MCFRQFFLGVSLLIIESKSDIGFPAFFPRDALVPPLACTLNAIFQDNRLDSHLGFKGSTQIKLGIPRHPRSYGHGLLLHCFTFLLNIKKKKMWLAKGKRRVGEEFHPLEMV